MARLRNSDKCTSIGNSLLLVYAIRRCTNLCETEGGICKGCASLPTDTIPSMKLIYDKLTDPIPADARIYGGPWYMKAVKKYGDVKNAKWLEEAKKIQESVEMFSPRTFVETPLPKKRGRKKQESVCTSLIPFVTIQPAKYVETNGPVEKLMTDSYKLSVKSINDIHVFVCENGMTFSIVNNNPGALLGFYKNDLFTPV